MLCTCYRGGQWHWLSAEDERRTGRLVLLERQGACPDDPDGTVVRLLGLVDAEALPGKAAAWLRHGRAAAAGDSRPTGDAPQTKAVTVIAADPRRPATWQRSCPRGRRGLGQLRRGAVLPVPQPGRARPVDASSHRSLSARRTTCSTQPPQPVR
jgi:hypothetical protein